MCAHVLDRIDLPDSTGTVLLYDPEGVVDGRNLVKVAPDGRLVWKAALPRADSRDCFVGMAWDGQTLTANTWSCYQVSADIQNGEVTALAFTK